MAKRRSKKKTHLQGSQSTSKPIVKNGTTAMDRSPQSMVIRMGAGEVGSSVSQLVKDVRAMMEPDTASRLKERKSNRLRDYTTMAGPLGVTHMLLFSKSSSGNTNFRIAVTPRGPTMHFRVENYSLCKDVAKAQKRPKGSGKTYRTPPLLVMNNFMTAKPPGEADDSKTTTPRTKSNNVPRHLESLATTVFQSLFPPILPQSTPLSSIRRLMLLNREVPTPASTETTSKHKDPKGDDSYILHLRHYAITTKRLGIPKRIRRLDTIEQRRTDKSSALPNLGKLEDMADYLLDPAAAGYTSASETELDTDAEVEVMETSAKRILSKKEMQRLKTTERKVPKSSSRSNVEKRAVKLVELGPRMKMRLIKVEEGLCGGRVMWHDYISKSRREERELDETWEKRRKEKELRKKQQKENVERKKREKEEARKAGKGQKGADENEEPDQEDEEGFEDEWDSEDFDDDDDDDDMDEDVVDKTA